MLSSLSSGMYEEGAQRWQCDSLLGGMPAALHASQQAETLSARQCRASGHICDETTNSSMLSV